MALRYSVARCIFTLNTKNLNFGGVRSIFLGVTQQRIVKVGNKKHVNLNPPPSSAVRNDLFDQIIDVTDGFKESEVEEVKDEVENKVSYEKISGKSHVLTSLMVNVKSRKRREKSHTILLEGKRLIEDALDAGIQPLALFFSRPGDVADFKLDPSVKLYRVPYKDLQFWSDLSTSQGVLGVFPTPDTSQQIAHTDFPLTIICDNVRDPGNMGAILRTCAGAGCQELLLTKGCVDIWEPKVLRSGAGSHFRIRIRYDLTWDEVAALTSDDDHVYLADSDAPKKDNGSQIGAYEISESGEKVPVENDPKRKTKFQKWRPDDSQVQLFEYSSPDYSSANGLILVIGGETEGLSEEAFKFAMGRKGRRVYLPLSNGVESLNSGTALGILAYEMKRQRLKSLGES